MGFLSWGFGVLGYSRPIGRGLDKKACEGFRNLSHILRFCPALSC